MARRYRYEATIKVVIAADRLDHAYHVQQEAARAIRAAALGDRVLSVHSSMLDLKHRPDLDGSLANPAPDQNKET